MFKHYLKASLRNLRRNKSFSLINIPGMALALASVILLLLFIHHEVTYDRFFEASDRIGRLVTHYEGRGKEMTMPKSIYEVDQQVAEEVPEVEASTVVFRRYFRYIRYQDNNYGRYQQSYVDGDFFDIFSFRILEGNTGALGEPNTTVLTRQTAAEIFGDEDPVNKTLEIDEKEFRVVAVMDDLPVKSHLQFDVLLSLRTLGEKKLRQHGHDFNTYLLLSQPVNTNLEKKICRVTEKIDDQRYGGTSVQFTHELQPLTRIHLHSGFSSDLAKTTDIQYIWIYSAIAFFILVIAAFNFVNLSMARGETRTREVGVRKVHGARPADLRKQFIGEAVLLAMGSFILSILLVEVFVDDFSRLVNSRLHLSFGGDYGWMVAGFLLSLFIGMGAGAYPAFYLSRLGSLTVLKGSASKGKQKMGLQQVLVSLQFVIAIILMASLAGILNQVRYVKNKDLGFQQKNVLAVGYLTSGIQDQYASIRQELIKNTNVLDVTASMVIPGTRGSGTNLRTARQQEKESFQVRANLVQPGFTDFYEIQVTEGRSFSPRLNTDRKGFLINQKAARMLGLTEAVGEEIHIWGKSGPVIGVFANYHNRSLHRELGPVVLAHIGKKQNLINHIYIKIADGQTSQVVEYAGKVLEDHDPSYTYQHYFLADYLQRRYYRKEEKYAGLMVAGTLMAMLIAVMGLFALTAFHINRKIKEIGIRKVMGASASRIVRMFAGRYLLWILLSAAIAFPVAYYFIRNWYNNFVYHSPIEWWFFGGSLSLAFFIALATVLGRTLAAANANPAHTLRDE
jgi:putative ABC transport system permease protein